MHLLVPVLIVRTCTVCITSKRAAHSHCFRTIVCPQVAPLKHTSIFRVSMELVTAHCYVCVLEVGGLCNECEKKVRVMKWEEWSNWIGRAVQISVFCIYRPSRTQLILTYVTHCHTCFRMLLHRFMVIHKGNKFEALMEHKGNYRNHRGTQCGPNISRFNSRHFLTQTLLYTIQFSYNIKYKHSLWHWGNKSTMYICFLYHTCQLCTIPIASFTSMPFLNWIRTFKSGWC